MKSRGYQGQASKSFLPVESLRICLIPPASNCGDTCEMSTRETHEKLSPQSFYWELITWAASAQHVPKFRTPRKKAGIQHKPYGLHNSLVTVSTFMNQGGWEHSQNPSSQTPVKGQPCKQDFLRLAVSGLPCSLFCILTQGQLVKVNQQ